MCALREWLLYCVNMLIFRMSELIQFDKGKSMVLNFPPNGIAGFECHCVSDFKRVPLPPAKIIARVFSEALRDVLRLVS